MRAALRPLALAALLGALGIARAEAACTPVLQNCWCSFVFPCPAPDFGVLHDAKETPGAVKKLSRSLGTVKKAYDRPASPVTPEMISGESLAVTQQLVRNGVRGPDNHNNVRAAHPRPDIRLPERDLAAAHHPQPAAAGASANPPGAIESFSSARQRHAAAFTSSQVLDAVGVHDLRAVAYGSARDLAGVAYARALLKRAQLDAHVDRAIALDAATATSKSLGEDMRVNASIRMALSALSEEVNEMLSLSLALNAMKAQTTSDLLYRPAPSLAAPHNTPPSEVAAREEDRAIMEAYSAYNAAVRKAEQAHNALTANRNLEDSRPRLLADIEAHEVSKVHAYAVEQDLRTTLAYLYQDPDHAWSVLQQRLHEDPSAYGDTDSYQRSAQLAARIDGELQGQAAVTPFGQRRINPHCATGFSADGSPCPRFAEAYWSGATPGVAQIERDYAGNDYESYRQGQDRIRIPTPATPDDPTSASATYVLMQYQLEANRRQAFWAELRRGGERTMSNDLWTELTTHAPSCLAGPMASNAANLRARPELFDLDPSCPHRSWASGPDAGQPIDDVHLGGSDRTLWVIDGRNAEYAATYSGRAEVEAHVAEAERIAQESRFKEKAEAAGLQDIVTRTRALEDILGQIRNDPENLRFTSAPS